MVIICVMENWDNLWMEVVLLLVIIMFICKDNLFFIFWKIGIYM